MAGIAGTRPVCSLLDVVHRRIPVIGHFIKIFHFDPGLLKGTSYSRYDPERCQGLAVTWIQAQDKIRFSRRAGVGMATVALAILTGRMTGLTACIIFVYRMSKVKTFILMAGLAFWTVLDVIFRFIHIAVTMHFLLLVAIHTHHALLVMDIRRSTVFPGEFRINAPAVTGSTGLSFVLLHKFMALEQAAGNAADRR